MALQLLTASFPISAFCLFLSYIVFRYRKKAVAPYPPGPPPKPFVGNAFDIPTNKGWLKYALWSKKFNSDIIHLSAMGTHIVVLESMEDVTELLDRRSANYSSRPPSPVTKLLGMENLVMMMPYGDVLKKQRRILDSSLRKDVISSYHQVQTEKVHLFLEQLLLNPAQFKAHCKWLATSVTMAMTFGYDVIPGQKRDRFVDLAEFSADAASTLLMPGKTLISVFPFLRHVPPWFPGASTQKWGKEVRDATAQYRIGPFEYVKRNMASGTSKDCILKRILGRREKGDKLFRDEEMVMDAISTLYLAAVETSQIVQLVFIMAMALHPMEQKLAQDEIDAVVGSDRLPTFADRTSLPYVEALFREALRWWPLGPLGFPHSTLEDDVYKGYYIPKDTLILTNIWAITRNEAVYPDPEAFKPERFLRPDGTLVDDTVGYMFGFGRRICPGRHMADSMLWLMIASVLATFEIFKAKDENGNEIYIDVNAFIGGLAVHPPPFKCSIVPRSQQAEALISS